MVSKFALSGSQKLKIFLPRRGGASGRRGHAPQGRRGLLNFQPAHHFVIALGSQTHPGSQHVRICRQDRPGGAYTESGFVCYSTLIVIVPYTVDILVARGTSPPICCTSCSHHTPTRVSVVSRSRAGRSTDCGRSGAAPSPAEGLPVPRPTARISRRMSPLRERHEIKEPWT